MVTSDKSSKRLEVNYVDFGIQSVDDYEIYEYILDVSKTFQEILGFGGAFTDSAAININLMENKDMVNDIIKAYYAPTGLDYSIGRLNMGGCDFSVRFDLFMD